MKRLKKALIGITLLVFVLILLASQTVFAIDMVNSLQIMEYSEEFLNWVNLPDDEKEKGLQPRIYDIPNTKIESQNPFYLAKMFGANLTTKYSLKDIIANNLLIRNQQETNSCWAFAALSSLETNMALADYNKGINASKIYDFSERHMEYSASRIFANDKENELGYNRNVGDGGSWYMSVSYLTNGSGAINESEMPFENNEDIIDISKIQNKTIASQVYDTKDFPTYNLVDDKSEIKEHIQNYGAVYAGIHGASLFTGDCYNNDTGAIFCDNSIFYPSDHAVTIIGWDDNYPIENFNENSRPESKGAWIIRNSWGERIEYDLAELKEEIFNQYEQQCIANNWTDPTLIPNEFLEKNGYIIENDKAIIKIGDNGIMYVSYEDRNIYKSLYGVTKASDNVEYENIYQYDEFAPVGGVSYANPHIMLCNIFKKKTTGTEYLTEVSLYAAETYTCKVYVNPNGTGKSKEDLQFVELKSGESETFDAGYHTLEFLEPIEIKADSFAVAIEIQGTRSSINVRLESKIDKVPTFDVVKVENEKCFMTSQQDFEEGKWFDLGKLTELNSSLINGDSTIKAFTVSNIEDNSLKNIEITTPPDKTEYFEGENFDTTGMIITANYKDNTSIVLDKSSYNITNGSNLKVGQTNVTITYENESVNQSISVEKNSITELKITTPPTKTEYKEGQNFDKSGMVVEAVYKDGSTRTITDYVIENGNNLKSNQKEVIITYEGKMVKQEIVVLPNVLIEIAVTKAPNKTKYVVGQNFDKTGMIVTGKYEDMTTQEIVDYTIENGTNLSKDQTSVIIKYDDKTTTQEIIVEEKTITGIAIIKKPSKLIYIQNKEELDLTGSSLKVTYNDGTEENISMTTEEVEVTGFNNKDIGKIIINVTYKSKTTQFEVEIIAEPVIEEKAENSNFAHAKCEVKKVQAYYYTNNSQKDYTLIQVEINNIIKNRNNDKNEYYYYLSSNKEEKNIKDWIKIIGTQNDGDKLQFTIRSKDIANYDEISSANVLYVYIKEVAIKGGNQSVYTSESMKLATDKNIETYLDDIKKEDIKKEDVKPNEPDIDDTIAPGRLPNAGIKITVIVLITITLIVGICLYARYKDLSNYVK